MYAHTSTQKHICMQAYRDKTHIHIYAYIHNEARRSANKYLSHKHISQTINNQRLSN